MSKSTFYVMAFSVLKKKKKRTSDVLPKGKRGTPIYPIRRVWN
jgi:hypothetical protein